MTQVEVMKNVQELAKLLSGVDHEVNDVSEFDEKLYSIFLTENSEFICPVLNLLNDNYDFSELMMSIIMTMEGFDNSIYVKSVLECFEGISKKAPYWSSVLLTRICNDERMSDYFKIYLNTDSNYGNMVRRIASELLKADHIVADDFKKIMAMI